MDITLKKIKVLDNRFIFAVECAFCNSLANEFNANNEPVCPQHAEHSAHLTDGIQRDLQEVITLEECTDVEHSPTPPIGR